MKNRKFFDEITDRTGTHSIKWDRVKEGGLAMWIADMDFRTPQAVTDSIIKRAENGFLDILTYRTSGIVHIRNGGKTDIIFLLIRNGLYLQPA